MKTQIKVTAPTHYQLESIMSFGILTKSHADGSYSATQNFNTKEDAKNYLRKVAEKMDDRYCDPVRLKENYADINKGWLTIDSATAFIEKIEKL